MKGKPFREGSVGSLPSPPATSLTPEARMMSAAPSAKKRHEQQAEGGLDTEEQTGLEAQPVAGHMVRAAV